MLQFIRSRVTSIFVKILFGLLIASFAIWGIGDIFLGNRGGQAAIKVGDIAYNSAEVLDQFERVRRRLGLQITAQQAAELGLLDNVIKELVNEGLFAAEGQSLGLAVGDAVIKGRIASNQAFQGPGGAFDPATFRQVLFNAGLSEAAFVDVLRKDVARSQIVEAVSTGSAPAKPLADALFRYREERRVVDMVRVPFDTITDLPSPSDSDIDTYYKANEQDFMAPEYRAVSYIAITPEDLASGVLVAEDELRAEYDARIDQYRTNATRNIDQILLDDEAKARTAMDRIKAGEDFAAVAKDLTGLDADALAFGEVTREELTGEAVREIVFSAEKGAITAPVQSDLGWHIFRVNSASDETVQSFEQVRDQIHTDMARDRALDSVFKLVNDLEDELGGGSTLEEAAKALDLKVRKVASVDSSGLDPRGKPVTSLPKDRSFITKVSQTKSGERSELIETRDGAYYQARVDRVTPPALRPLSEVRAAVVSSWTADKRAELGLQKAEAIRNRTKEGVRLAKAAGDVGMTLAQSKPFTRSGDGLEPTDPTDLASLAFSLKSGEADLSESETVAVVFELKQIVPADAMKAKDAHDRLTEELRQNVSADLVETLTTALRSEHEVTVDRGYIDALLRESQ